MGHGESAGLLPPAGIPAAWGGQVWAQRWLFPGAIHKATVKVVNVELSCVTVEWIEGGATKGKEVS